MLISKGDSKVHLLVRALLSTVFPATLRVWGRKSQSTRHLAALSSSVKVGAAVGRWAHRVLLSCVFFQKSVRLVVNYLRTQKAVVRVSPEVPLQSILPVICAKCDVSPEHVVLLRDNVAGEELELSKSLNELGIKELYAWDNKRGESLPRHAHTERGPHPFAQCDAQQPQLDGHVSFQAT